jgi:hypothetical protein
VLVVEGIIMCGCVSQQVCGVTKAVLQGNGSRWDTAGSTETNISQQVCGVAETVL